MTGLQLRLSEVLQADVMRSLFASGLDEAWVPERGFLGLVGAGRGLHRRFLFLKAIVAQEPGWVNETADGLKFSPKYFSRALSEANRATALTGLMIVHSHPGGSVSSSRPPLPSGPDLTHERQLLWLANQALRPGAPVAAGIVGSNGRWRVREYQWPRPVTPRQAKSPRFAATGGTFEDSRSTRLVGAFRSSTFWAQGKEASSNPMADSTLKLWGESGQAVLRDLSIGIAGAGGVGSMLVEQVARLGFGRLVLVDYDSLKPENLNRSAGAATRDLKRPKVDYLATIARRSAVADGFVVKSYRESVSEWAGLRPLLDCDLILNAADNPFARQVVDFAAYAYELPVVDGGTVFLISENGDIRGKSQVSEAGPGRPCLECQGVYTREDATLARESPRQQGPFRYVVPSGSSTSEEPPRAPSVISHNGLVASLMAQRALRIALGFPPHTQGYQQRFYVESGEIRWGPVRQCAPGCPKPSLVGAGDGYPIPVGTDPFLAELRTAEPAPRHRLRQFLSRIRSGDVSESASVKEVNHESTGN